MGERPDERPPKTKMENKDYFNLFLYKLTTKI
jgi:hypothetical protein